MYASDKKGMLQTVRKASTSRLGLKILLPPPTPPPSCAAFRRL
jgi:hypothetical protein